MRRVWAKCAPTQTLNRDAPFSACRKFVPTAGGGDCCCRTRESAVCLVVLSLSSCSDHLVQRKQYGVMQPEQVRSYEWLSAPCRAISTALVVNCDERIPGVEIMTMLATAHGESNLFCFFHNGKNAHQPRSRYQSCASLTRWSEYPDQTLNFDMYSRNGKRSKRQHRKKLRFSLTGRVQLKLDSTSCFWGARRGYVYDLSPLPGDWCECIMGLGPPSGMRCWL